MQKIELYKDIKLSLVNFDEITKELKGRYFTGYFKLSYWDRIDYLFFSSGSLLRGVSVKADGELLEIGFPYTPEGDALLSVYQCQLMDVLSLMYMYDMPVGPYAFISVGRVVMRSIKLAHLDRDSLLSNLSEEKSNGLLVIHDSMRIKNMVVFERGLPVAVCSANSCVTTGRVSVPANREDYVSFVEVSPEYVPFVASCLKGRHLEVHSFEGLEEFRKGVSSILPVGLSAIVSIVWKSGKVYRELYHFGSLVDYFSVSEEGFQKERIQEDTYLKAYIQSFELEKVTGIDVDFSLESAKDKYVDTSVVNYIRERFVDEIGPVGPLIWRKIMKENDMNENMLTLDKLRRLVKLLADEIPDESSLGVFLNKIRRYVE